SRPPATARPRSRRPITRPGPSPATAAAPQACAPRPNLPALRRRSSTIPPACCAGSDHGGPLAHLDRFCHHGGGGRAALRARRIQRRLRAVGVDLLLDVDLDLNVLLDLDVELLFLRRRL